MRARVSAIRTLTTFQIHFDPGYPPSCGGVEGGGVERGWSWHDYHVVSVTQQPSH